MVAVRHRGGHRTRWPWPMVVLVLAVIVSGAAVLWMVVNNATNASAIRFDAERALLIAGMEDAVQVESEYAGHLVGQLSTDADHAAMGEMNMTLPDAAPSVGLLADPAVREAIASFDETAGALRALMSPSEEGNLGEIVRAHDMFVLSMAELDARVEGATDAMSFYHSTTQTLEADLRTSLDELQESSSRQLQATIGAVRSAESLSRWVLPLLLLAGLISTGHLLRMRGAKRRVIMLEALVEAKNEFIGAVSHELRTPLTGIVGFTDVLRDAEDELSPQDRAEILASIAVQSQEVVSLVEDLLVAARTDIGQLTVIAVPVDLREQTAQILELHEQSTGQRIRLDGEGPIALGDPVRVRQIVRNLVSNAGRYGGDDIRIVLGGGDTSASLRVKDSGPPLGQEDQQRIFEPYQQAHRIRGVAGSMGLGLSVSRHLARLMDGDLTYGHRDGYAIFELTLPVATETGTAVVPVGSAAITGPADSADLAAPPKV